MPFRLSGAVSLDCCISIRIRCVVVVLAAAAIIRDDNDLLTFLICNDKFFPIQHLYLFLNKLRHSKGN